MLIILDLLCPLVGDGQAGRQISQRKSAFTLLSQKYHPEFLFSWTLSDGSVFINSHLESELPFLNDRPAESLNACRTFKINLQAF